MAKTVFTTPSPVVLEGFQSILKPGKFGYCLEAILDEDLVLRLVADRADLLKAAKERLKNPKRATLKPEPWEEVSEGKYKVKFTWKPGDEFPIVDAEGSVIEDENLPLFSGSRVKLGFIQKYYVLKDGITYGTSVKLVGVQVVSLGGSAGTVSYDATEVAALFGRTEGFKAAEYQAPEQEEDSTEAEDEPVEEEDDF